jgi:SAM-dependent methyltransferase
MTLKLDLGAGAVSPPGYIPMGNAHGTAVFPLPYADGAVDAIHASHILEHFPHGQVADVVAEWVRVLRPGGTLHIAVPDFARVARGYLAGAEQPTEGYVMGGQTDGADFHRSLFDDARLKEIMAGAGLVLLRPWRPELDDCAALPISLNLCGVKPHRGEANVRAVMSVPRLGFNDTWNCAMQALPALGIELTKVSGAFWDQCLTLAIEQALADDRVDYILALDYDSVFHRGHVARLIELALVHPEADAIAPLQASRHTDKPLFGVEGADGTSETDVAREDIEVDLYKVRQAHFGLTLIKAAALRAMPKPWFVGTPDADGGWGSGKMDPDIHFWRRWEAAGNRLMLAPRVAIGHLELMVRWPDQDMRPVWQSARDWEATRQAPATAWTGMPS